MCEIHVGAAAQKNYRLYIIVTKLNLKINKGYQWTSEYEK